MTFGTYELIGSNTVSGSSTTSVTFSSIPQIYTDLQIILTSKINDTNPYYVGNLIRLNGDNGNNYYVNGMYNFYGNFTPQSTAGVDSNINVEGTFGSSTSYSTAIIDILNYTSTNTFKGYVARAGGSGVAPLVYNLKQGAWASTSAVTSVVISSQWIWTAGSYFALYGMRNR